MDQSTQPPFITDDTWQCGINTLSVAHIVANASQCLFLCLWNRSRRCALRMTTRGKCDDCCDWLRDRWRERPKQWDPVCCLSRVKAMGLWSAGTSSAKSVSRQHSEPIEGDNPRSVLSVSAHDPLLGGQASHTRTQSWMEASVCLFPGRLITKDKDCLHSNIWIPPFTGCNGGDTNNLRNNRF